MKDLEDQEMEMEDKINDKENVRSVKKVKMSEPLRKKNSEFQLIEAKEWDF